jgi:hypothetical protein
MEDKEFLNNFWELSSEKKIGDKKKGCFNIINTLLASETISLRKGSDLMQHPLKMKYSNLDFGNNISEDLNYTLKRLVSLLSIHYFRSEE